MRAEALTSPLVGIDVVDLLGEATTWHPRFPARVLTSRELAEFDRSSHQTRTLWRLWAAKEAAFKALSPVFDLDRFRPHEWEVHDNMVTWLEHSIPVTICETTDWLLATACNGRPTWKVGNSSNDETSSAERIARDIAGAMLRLRPTEISIHRDPQGRPCWPLPLRLSLSHHGRFAAAAVALS